MRHFLKKDLDENIVGKNICFHFWYLIFSFQVSDLFSLKQILQDDLNKKILDSLLEFIKKCSLSFQSRANDWASLMRASEIPTAALVLGTFIIYLFLIHYFKYECTVY